MDKVSAKIVESKLTLETPLKEAQHGFRLGRNKQNLMFIVRQLIEKLGRKEIDIQRSFNDQLKW